MRCKEATPEVSAVMGRRRGGRRGQGPATDSPEGRCGAELKCWGRAGRGLRGPAQEQNFREVKEKGKRPH